MLRQADPHEALPNHMLRDVAKGDQPRIALGDIQPVPRPGVVDNVRLTAQPNPDTVAGVIEQRQEDEDPLQHPHHRQAVEEPHLRPISGRPFSRLVVREQMFQQKSAEWDDPH